MVIRGENIVQIDNKQNKSCQRPQETAGGKLTLVKERRKSRFKVIRSRIMVLIMYVKCEKLKPSHYSFKYKFITMAIFCIFFSDYKVNVAFKKITIQTECEMSYHKKCTLEVSNLDLYHSKGKWSLVKCCTKLVNGEGQGHKVKIF